MMMTTVVLYPVGLVAHFGDAYDLVPALVVTRGIRLPRRLYTLQTLLSCRLILILCESLVGVK
jgi:hypothetical protein